MVVIRNSREGSDHNMIIFHVTDTWLNGEYGSMITGAFGASSNEALRTWRNITGKTVTFDRWATYVTTNSNTIAGADMVPRINSVDQVSMIIALDQLVGLVTNLTESVDVIHLNNFNWVYRQGDSSVNLRTFQLRNNWGKRDGF